MFCSLRMFQSVFNSYVSTFIYCCFTQSENKPFFLKKYVPKVIKKLCWDSYMFSMSTHAFGMKAPYRQVPRADACGWLSPPVLWWPSFIYRLNKIANQNVSAFMRVDDYLEIHALGIPGATVSPYYLQNTEHKLY